MQLPEASSGPPRAATFLVVVFLLLGLLLRAHDLGHGLWLDELHTAWTVGGGLDDVAPRVRIGNQSPTYFYLEWGIVQVFGVSEISLRWLSLCASMGLIVVATWATWRWTASGVAMVAVAGLLALDRLFIFYAQDARPYALLHLIALFQLLAMVEVLSRARPSWRIELVISSVALLYIHYSAALFLLAEAVVVTVAWLWKKRLLRGPYRAGNAIFDSLVVLVLAVPLMPAVFEVASRRGNWAEFIPRPRLHDLATMFPLDVWLLYPALAVGVLLLLKQNQSTSSRWVQNTALVQLLLGVFLAFFMLAWLISWLDVARLFYKRYLMIGAVVPVLATVIIGASLKERKLTVAYFATLIVGLVISPLQPSTHSVVRNFLAHDDFSGHDREPWRAAAELVQANTDVAVPVFVRSGFIECTPESLTTPKWRAYGSAPVNNIYDLSSVASEVIPLATALPCKISSEGFEKLSRAGDGWFVLRGGARLADDTAAMLLKRLNVADSWQVTQRVIYEGRPSVSVLRLQRVTSGMPNQDELLKES